MARQIILAPADEEAIVEAWGKLTAEYPMILAEDCPLDYTLADFRDDIILELTPNI